jgi:hypothetical protein
MEMAVQVLVVLLDFGFPIKTSSSPTPETSAAGTSSQIPYVASRDFQSAGFNVFRKYLSSIDTPDELNFMFTGFARLLNNVRYIDRKICIKSV